MPSRSRHLGTPPDQGLRNAKALAGLLNKNRPGAAASLREGLEEMFTSPGWVIDGRSGVGVRVLILASILHAAWFGVDEAGAGPLLWQRE